MSDGNSIALYRIRQGVAQHLKRKARILATVKRELTAAKIRHQKRAVAESDTASASADHQRVPEPKKTKKTPKSKC